MKQIHFDLVKFLVELSTIKKVFMAKPIFKNSMPRCKERMVDSYIYAISEVLVFLSTAISEIELSPSKELAEKKCKYLESIFDSTFIAQEIKHGKISSLYYLFWMFRKRLEYQLFSKLDRQISDLISKDKIEDFPTIYKSFCTRLYTIAELSALYLSGIQLHCKNFKEEVFGLEAYANYPENILKDHCDDNCELHEVIDSENEKFHIFMLEEFEYKEFLVEMALGLSEIHTKPGNIHVVIDYKLRGAFKYTQKHYSAYTAASGLFNSVTVINSDHIDFASFRNKLNIQNESFSQETSELLDTEVGDKDNRKIPMMGKVLINKKKITEEELIAALDEQKKRDDGSLLGDILKKNYGLSDEEVLNAIKEQNTYL